MINAVHLWDKFSLNVGQAHLNSVCICAKPSLNGNNDKRKNVSYELRITSCAAREEISP